MIKLELEKMLEAGFGALGVDFSKREYFENIKMGAEVDDSLVGEMKPWHDAEGFVDYLMNVTEYQLDSEFEGLFFRRAARNCRGFHISYEVVSVEHLQAYEKEADRIIREDKIEEQAIWIGDLQKDTLMGLIIGGYPEMPKNFVTVDYLGNPEDLEQYLISMHKDPATMLAPISRLTDRAVPPEEVCKALFGFLRA